MKSNFRVAPTASPLSNRQRAAHFRKWKRGEKLLLFFPAFANGDWGRNPLLPSPACGNGQRIGDWTRGWRWGLMLALFLPGCVNPIPPATLAKKVAEKKEPTPIPARIDGKGWHIAWNSRDTAQAKARAVPVLVANAETGEFTSDTDPPALGLNTVQAQIFQDGKHVADIVAARIDANRGEQTVYGSGGVAIHSLVNPPDTTITADSMQWNATTSRLIAEGNAKLSRPARDKQQAFAQSGNRIVYNMKQGNFDVQ